MININNLKNIEYDSMGSNKNLEVEIALTKESKSFIFKLKVILTIIFILITNIPYIVLLIFNDFIKKNNLLWKIITTFFIINLFFNLLISFNINNIINYAFEYKNNRIKLYNDTNNNITEYQLFLRYITNYILNLNTTYFITCIGMMFYGISQNKKNTKLQEIN